MKMKFTSTYPSNKDNFDMSTKKSIPVVPTNNGNMAERLTPKEKLECILRESKRVPATSDANDIKAKPPWFDQERHDRAQKLVSEIFYSCLAISSFTGLMLLVQVPDILKALLRTGKSKSVIALMNRYVDTTKHVTKWYESKNLFDSQDPGNQSIKMVRLMHKRIFTVMNEENAQLELLKEKGTNDVSILEESKQAANYTGSKGHRKANHIWVNQMDMIMTQFSFAGLMLLYPEKCGAIAATDQDLLDVGYYWRTIAYLIGIEDKFNLFTYDNLEDQREFLRLFFHQQFNVVLEEERDPVGTAMAEGIFFGYENILTDFTYNTLDHWWRPMFNMAGGKPKPLTFIEKVKHAIFKFYMNYLFSVRAILPYITFLQKRKFDNFVKEIKKHEKNLSKKYGQLEYL